MNRLINFIKIILLGLMLGFPVVAFSVPEAGKTVTKTGTINDDYYAAGGTVNIDADIAGDVVASGGELFIGHRVQGDVIAAGGSVQITGEILDDVRVAGGELTINAKIGDDLYAAGGAIRVESGSAIDGKARLAGGDVNMAGTVKEGLFIAAGKIRLSGTIDGDVELLGNEIQILEGTIIKGDLLYKSPGEASINPDAKITGKVTHETKTFAEPDTGSTIFFSLALIVASIVLYLLFPGYTMASANRILSTPWKSLGTGIVILFIVPIAALLLLVTGLGVWVGLSIVALYLVALLTGVLISFFSLGDWGAKRLQQDVTSKGRRLLSVAIVIVIVALIRFIPVIGGLLLFVLLLVGLGAGSMQLYEAYKQAEKA